MHSPSPLKTSCMSFQNHLYLPWILGNPGGNPVQQLCECVSVHADIRLIVHVTFLVQLLEQVVILGVDSPVPHPGLHPPSSGGPSVPSLFSLPPPSPEGQDSQQHHILIPAICSKLPIHVLQSMALCEAIKCHFCHFLSKTPG